MKIIENYCTQPRRWADSEGWLKIELEPGDDREAIIKQYHYEGDTGWEETCIFRPDLSTDTLLVFEKHQVYND